MSVDGEIKDRKIGEIESRLEEVRVERWKKKIKVQLLNEQKRLVNKIEQKAGRVFEIVKCDRYP